MSIAVEIEEQDYRPASSFTAFWTAGEYGPLACGCCLVALEFDPCGPCLCLVMQRKDTDQHDHSPSDFTNPCEVSL